MNLPLFGHPYQEVDWPKVLRLDGRTANGRAFELLLRHKASAVDLSRPEISGLGYRSRLTDLRGMGIPIINEPIDGRPYHRYSLPPTFVALYWNRRARG